VGVASGTRLGWVCAAWILAALPVAGFEPPVIVRVINPVDDGRPTTAERSYSIDRGSDDGIILGDHLRVYRERRAESDGPAVRVFLGLLRLYHVEPHLAAGHFTLSESVRNDSSIIHRTAMVSDIVVPGLAIESDLLFDEGEISLRPRAGEQFRAVSDFVEAYRPDRLVILGHTDESDDPDASQELSLKQAETVRLYLIEDIPSVTPAMAEARGLGSRIPLARNDSPENRARNRRIEIIAWD
jgi:hypothetical protein